MKDHRVFGKRRHRDVPQLPRRPRAGRFLAAILLVNLLGLQVPAACSVFSISARLLLRAKPGKNEKAPKKNHVAPSLSLLAPALALGCYFTRCAAGHSELADVGVWNGEG